MGTENVKHVHTCPKCFEHDECRAPCFIEDDLGLTKGGLPRSHHITCEKCECIWTLSDALDFVRSLEHEIAKIGYHVGLRGGVLMRGESAHDLDLIIYPHDSTNVHVDKLYKVLCRSGLERQKTVAQVIAGWRAQGSNDEKYVEIWTFGERVVDILFV